MQTIGYYCDECRRKYVRHVCKEGQLPCGHPDAIRVYCKAWGRHGGERVALGDHTAMIYAKEQEHPLVYAPGGFYFWNHVALDDSQEERIEMPLAEWLKKLGPRYLRAFEQRWDSIKRPPDWVDLLRNQPVRMDDIEHGDQTSVLVE